MQYPNESISRSTGQDEVSNDSDSDDSRCYYNRRVYLNTLNERNSIFVKVCFIFVVVLERTAYYSLSANLTFFLLEYLNYSSSLSIVTTQFFIYTTWISCIIGGVLGDFILGRFRTIIFGFFVYIIGFGMLPAINFVVNPNNVPNTNQSTQVTKNQLTVNYNSTPNIENKYIVWVFFSLFLVSIGEGCFKSNMSPFGADQINDTDDVELKKYFQYYYWALNIGAFTGYSALTLIQQEYGFIKGYPISVALLIIALIVFCIPQVKNYNAVVPARKKFLVKILKICCNSKRKADNKYSKYESYVPIQHWLDRAKEVYGGKYSESDVEDIKKLFSVLPMFFYYILYFAAFNQVSTFYLLQGIHMKVGLRLSSKITVPACWLGIINIFTIVIFVPIFSKYIKNAKSYYLMVSIGMVFSVLSLYCGGVVENYRIINGNTLVTNNFGNIMSVNASDMSIFYQVPQYMFIGLSEIFVVIPGLKYAYCESPKSMQSLVTSILYLVYGLGAFLSSMLTLIVEMFPNFLITRHTANEPSIIILNGNLDFYLYLLAFLNLLNWFVFMAHFWIKNKRQERLLLRRNILSAIPTESIS
ncbi:solute carrier family 15 member 4 isoform X2 [Hydra vulgaris]|uniref:solute carrier family 15 member 4 isoform X2 n=1 Tax=Hydra vulgaris TaxID=6087 RepID=UPI001F5EDC58|nr:solute carrier family 15 member 4 isoform X2 [Hydra vulgaris]